MNKTTEIHVMASLGDIYANPYQPRETEDLQAVAELAESIERNGLMQTPTARVSSLTPSPSTLTGTRPEGRGEYELAFGHSRLAAYKLLHDQGKEGYKEMPLIVRELTDLQMFELGVGENMKRRDLNPMEEAHAIHTYMTTFNKTSAEAGAFFNKSPEAVRGAIRLVNLPEKAQAKLRSGEINVTTARALLVVEKLTDADSVEAMLETMDDDKTDESPSEVIRNALHFSDDTQELNSMEWASVEVFPVKHLPGLTRKDIEKEVFSPDQSEKAARQELQTVERMMPLVQSGMEITYDAFPNVEVQVVERVRTLMNPPACEKCPFFAVLDGDKFCGLIACSIRKAAAWEKHEAETISVKSGIALYQKSDGPKTDLDPYDDGDKKLVKDRHADLRLVPAKGVWSNFDGIGRKLRVAAVGDLNAKKQKKQAAEKAKEEPRRRTPERDWELEHRLDKLAREIAVRFIWDVVSPVFAKAFDGMSNLHVLKSLGKKLGKTLPDGIRPQKNAKKADALNQERRYLAYCMALEFANLAWGEHKSLSAVSKICVKASADWDVKLPKDLDKQKYQAEFDAAKKDVIGKRAKEKAK